MRNRTRLLLVDDQVLFVRSLKTVLETDTEDIRVVGIAENGKEAIEIVEKKLPDMILMDVRMPVMDGVEATRIISHRFPQVRIIVLTTFDDDEYVRNALKYGAMGYLLKTIPPRQLIASIHAIREGIVLMDPQIAARLVQKAFSYDDRGAFQHSGQSDLDDLIRTLSRREREVLQMLGQGLGNKQICQRLFIADSTVRNHISIIYSKLGVESRYEAMQIAVQVGLV